MDIEVLFFGQLRDLTSVHGATVVLKGGARLAELMDRLGEEYGIAFRDKVSNVKGLRILINGREHTLLGGMEAPLADGDTLVLLPPIFGG